MDIQRIREDFPLFQPPAPPLIYLDNAATTQKPRQVIDCLSHFYRYENANIHRGVYRLSEEASRSFEHARQKIARFIKARSPAEIVFTKGTTESINLVARGYGDLIIRAGDAIVATIMEHHSNLVPWQNLARAKKARLSLIPLEHDGQLNLAQAETALRAKGKILAITGLSNVLGLIPSLEKLIALAHDCGAIVIVDAAQYVAHVPVDVRQLDCDFLVFSGHKLYGPTGIGVLYGKSERLRAMPPLLVGGDMVADVNETFATYQDIPRKFEAGTPPIAEAIALGRAVDYLEEIGLASIQTHEQQLVRACCDRLSTIPGLQLCLPPEVVPIGIIPFNIKGLDANEVAALLDSQGIAIRAGWHCAQPLHQALNLRGTCRISLALYNTMAEVETVCQVLTGIGRSLSH